MVVCIRIEPTAPTKWHLASIVQVHPRNDGEIRFVMLQTEKGIYKHHIAKIVPLIWSTKNLHVVQSSALWPAGCWSISG